MSDVQSRVRQFLSSTFPQHELEPDEDLFALGFGGPAFASRLANFIEQELGVELDDADLDLDNFRSLAAIEAFIARKRAADAPA